VEPAGLDTPELGQLAETYRHMTDAEILRLAIDVDSLADEAVDLLYLYAEVCKRNLEEAVAGEGGEIAAGRGGRLGSFFGRRLVTQYRILAVLPYFGIPGGRGSICLGVGGSLGGLGCLDL